MRGVHHGDDGVEEEVEHREEELRGVDHERRPEDRVGVGVEHAAGEEGVGVGPGEADGPEVGDALFLQEVQAVDEDHGGRGREGGEATLLSWWKGLRVRDGLTSKCSRTSETLKGRPSIFFYAVSRSR